MLESTCQSFSMDFFEEPTADSTASQRGSRCFDLALVKRTGKEANGESEEGRKRESNNWKIAVLAVKGAKSIDFDLMTTTAWYSRDHQSSFSSVSAKFGCNCYRYYHHIMFLNHESKAKASEEIDENQKMHYFSRSATFYVSPSKIFWCGSELWGKGTIAELLPQKCGKNILNKPLQLLIKSTSLLRDWASDAGI